MMFLSSFLLTSSYDLNLLQASAGVGGLLSVHTRAHTATYSAAPQQKNSQRSPHEGAEVQHAAQGEQCLNASGAQFKC